MIHFLRQIRQKLLSQNKFRNYFFYALGEIFLVVVGILIALSINNWNENRKARIKEVKLLNELKADLIETKNDLLTDIEKAKRILSTTNDLYKAVIGNQISSSNPFELPTGYILETSTLFPKLSAYQALQSEGITIISNDNLRKEVTDFYQLHLPRVSGAESFLQDLNRNVLKPYLNSTTSHGSNCHDCEDLYDLYANLDTQENLYLLHHVDEELVHILKEKFNVFKTLNQRYSGLSQHIDEITILIEKETKKRS